MVIVAAAATVPVSLEYYGLSICHVTAQLMKLGFDKLITSKIINALYGITMLLLAIAAIMSFVNGNADSAVALIVSAVFCRVFFECVMVAFKNNEYLRRIAEALEYQK